MISAHQKSSRNVKFQKDVSVHPEVHPLLPLNEPPTRESTDYYNGPRASGGGASQGASYINATLTDEVNLGEGTLFWLEGITLRLCIFIPAAIFVYLC